MKVLQCEKPKSFRRPTTCSSRRQHSQRKEAKQRETRHDGGQGTPNPPCIMEAYTSAGPGAVATWQFYPAAMHGEVQFFCPAMHGGGAKLASLKNNFKTGSNLKYVLNLG